MNTAETTCGRLDWETYQPTKGGPTWVFALFHEPKRAEVEGLCKHCGPDACEALQAWSVNPHSGKWWFTGSGAKERFRKALKDIALEEEQTK
ncbi:MAG: hypothetical protein ACRC4O_02305 [Giesbergeria sp.]